MTTPSPERPTISFLDPSSVSRDWEGTVSIFGSNFAEGSIAFFDAKNPKTTLKSSSHLEVEVKRDITGTAGTKKVKVHSAGDLSNIVDFTVEQKNEYQT